MLKLVLETLLRGKTQLTRLSILFSESINLTKFQVVTSSVHFMSLGAGIKEKVHKSNFAE